MQRRATIHIPHVNIRAAIEQRLRRLYMPAHSPVQRRVAPSVLHTSSGTRLQESGYNGDVAIARGLVQGRSLVEVGGVCACPVRE